MAVQVRLKNFQSIEDASLRVEGLTVITGTNHSGKTAVMRAIRGLFTNAPAGPLVRHGAAHLTVALTFDDGTEVVWEKGWEKPGQKGKTVNQYTVNGQKLALVGRGVPPEVAALGVHSINAGSDVIWPQIAEQITGSLFLVDRPGSVVAEALSDVERVGKLTTALKASEKDRRSVVAELKVRRKDVKAHEEALSRFDGLDGVSDQVGLLTTARDALVAQGQTIHELSQLAERLQAARDSVRRFDGFSVEVPEGTRAVKCSKAVEKVTRYRDRYQRVSSVAAALQGFGDIEVPSDQSLLDGRAQMEVVEKLLTSLRKAKGEVVLYQGLGDADLPTTDQLNRIRSSVGKVKALSSSRESALQSIQHLDAEAVRIQGELEDAEKQVTTLLGDRGVCPTCNTVHEGGH